MSLIHSPTSLSCAIGAVLTVLDQCFSPYLTSAHPLEQFDTVRLRTGKTVLEELQSVGLVTVHRDEAGQIKNIVQHVGHSTIAHALLEVGRRFGAAV